MVKRKCETCRYYRDAGIACSGWCTHPERGDISDLVLVRRAELACRNSWDQDLWQPRPAGARALKLTPVNAHEPHIPRVEEAPPAAPPVAAAVDNPTDRVTSIMVSRLESQRELAGMPPPVAGGQSARVASPPDAEGREQPRAGAREGVSALEPGYNRALRVKSGAPATAPPTERMDTGAIENALKPDRERVPTPPRAAQGSTVGDQTSPLPTEEINRIFRVRLSEAREAAMPAPPARPNLDVRVSHTVTEDSVAKVHIDGINLADVTTPGRFSEPPTPTAPLGPSPIDETKWVAPIPRSCDTCRDFQRDPHGRTGYCGNANAFARRTVVECEQLACRSSIGVWWLPNDDFWLDRAEISHHTRPTPYLDAILSELRSATR